MPSTTALAIARNHSVKVTFTPIPEDAKLPPLPNVTDHAGHYQQLLLNVRTGELTVFCADWRLHLATPSNGGDRALWDAQHPGSIPNTQAYDGTAAVPELLTFYIDTWTPIDAPADYVPPTPAFVYMDREQSNAFGARLVPLAQVLVSNLLRVPGTDDLEWSAESVAASYALRNACSRYQQGTPGPIDTAGIIDFADAVAAMPSLVEPEWAEMDNAGLDRAADMSCRFIGHHNPELTTRFGKPYHDGSGIGLDVYGSRAWLYAYRAHEANNRKVVGAPAWYSDPAHTLTRRVSADYNDDDIAELAAREVLTAGRAQVKLVGAEKFIRAYRDELRKRIVEEDLPQARQMVERLANAKAARAGLLGQIIGWGDPCCHSDNDAELGRRAGMTRQAVNQLRSALTEDDTDA